MKQVKLGELVVVNSLVDTPLYRVVDTDGKFGVGLIDSTIEDKVKNQSVQWIDICCLQKPTKAQLAYNA